MPVKSTSNLLSTIQASLAQASRRPYVALSYAQSIDGSIASRPGRPLAEQGELVLVAHQIDLLGRAVDPGEQKAGWPIHSASSADYRSGTGVKESSETGDMTDSQEIEGTGTSNRNRYQMKKTQRIMEIETQSTKERNMKKTCVFALLCFVLLLAGCAAPETQTKTQKGAIYGAAGGAAAGAIAGQVISHDTKGTLIGAAIGAAVGGLGGAGVGKMMDNQEKDMRGALATSEAASVSREGNLLAVTFKGDVTFDTNSTVVRPGLHSEINRVAGVLNQYPNTLVRVEGHTDSKGSSEYNMDLSNRRATAVKNLLVQRGIADSRIDVVGYGETMSVATNDTEAGRQKNRRVEIKIAPQTQQ